MCKPQQQIFTWLPWVSEGFEPCALTPLCRSKREVAVPQRQLARAPSPASYCETHDVAYCRYGEMKLTRIDKTLAIEFRDIAVYLGILSKIPRYYIARSRMRRPN